MSHRALYRKMLDENIEKSLHSGR
ncbi:MAG: hypothetical protein ABSF43_01630 [Rectinemataceae bacterium]